MADSGDGSPLGIRVVCVSDTHGGHRKLGALPAGDVLIHAGDFTHFGKRHQAEDLNAWLGEQSGFQHRLVVNGNHECNAEWKDETRSILSNARFLCDELVELEVTPRQWSGASADGERAGEGGGGAAAPKLLRVWGTQFYWPVTLGLENEAFVAIAPRVDVVVAHGPAHGFVDGEHPHGCPSLARQVRLRRPRLLVCGHIHHASGVHDPGDGSTIYCNAANCGSGSYAIANSARVVDI